MNQNLPKVLVITINAWNVNGNSLTLMDLFRFWDVEKIAQVYTRSDLPNTNMCNRFFRISENLVIKSVFNKKIVAGDVVHNSLKPTEEMMNSICKEHKLYSKARKKHSWFMTLCREVVWLFGKWKTKKLDEFIELFDPDVIFVPIYPTVYMGIIQRYIINKTKKPVVSYIADDNYSYKSCGINIFSYIHRFFLRTQVKKIINLSEELFVIVPKQKTEYDKIFKIESMVLTRGIDYSRLNFVKKKVNSPIKMVYTGRLVIGRGKSLALISRALSEINKDMIRVEFDIYSPDVVNKKIMKMLNSNGCFFKGQVTKNEVDVIQENADIVVFVESLGFKFRNSARLSFSTKITDYFKNGKCIFAIGRKNIAPIEYLKEEDAAVIATNYLEIKNNLKMLLDDSKMIDDYGKKAYDCGKKNHNLTKMNSLLLENILKVTNKPYK